MKTQVFRRTPWSRVWTLLTVAFGDAVVGAILFFVYRGVDPQPRTTADLVWQGVVVGVPLLILVGGLWLAFLTDHERFEVQGATLRVRRKDKVLHQVNDVSRYVYGSSQHISDGEVMAQKLHLMPVDGLGTPIEVDCVALSDGHFDEMLSLLESRGLKKFIPTLN